MANTVSRILSDETLNRIIQIESAGRLAARAPTSSALGLFQFINATWLAVVRKHRPDLLEGRTQTDVLAMRTDPAIAIELGARFTEDNARALGEGCHDGDLYLAHFLGVATARKFLRAPASASAETLAGAAAVRANRAILTGKTAGQVRAWAERAMLSRWDKAGRPDWIAQYYLPSEPADEPDDVRGVGAQEPKPLLQSKIAQAGAGVGLLGGTEALTSANDAASQVAQLKNSADDVGLWDIGARLIHSPRFWIAAAIVVLIALVLYWRWRDHGKGQHVTLTGRAR